MEQIPVYILAGGKSSRFGSDKARALFRGQPLISSLAAFMKPAAARITVVASKPGEYRDLGLRTIGDITPGNGPLGGLLSALQDNAASPWLLLLSCDLLGLRMHWIERLLASRREGVMAVHFHGRYPEPFPALYHQSLRLVAEAHLDRNQRAMQNLLTAPEVSACSIRQPRYWRTLRNVNFPAELESCLS
jgi:molybdopterin-guanine dinucleotide biosynthesis protein A